MRIKGSYKTKDALRNSIKAARGEIKADLVFSNVQFLDVFSGNFVTGDVAVYEGKIVGILDEYEGVDVVDAKGSYLVPGFIDSHVHIESTLVTPARFQQSVLPCGTTTVFWDPHEIANVKGSEGLQWAFDSSEGLAMDIFIMLSSCVPATSREMGLETSGAELKIDKLLPFKDHPRTLGLAEMMNFPGLLMGHDEVIDKIHAFEGMKKDGHCPGLLGKDLNAYGTAGIHSCHESTKLDEAKEKLMKGIHVLVREGSCAKDADELLPLIDSYSSSVVALCTDDRNPLDIAEEGHLDFIINKALKAGHSPENIFRAASFAAACAYGLEDRGAVAPGYQADLVLIDKNSADWKDGFKIKSVYKSGKKVDAAALKKVADGRMEVAAGKNMNIDPIVMGQLGVKAPEGKESVCSAKVIGVIPGSIVSKPVSAELKISAGLVHEDLGKDVLKIAVFERHHKTGNHGVGFVKGFDISKGAIATSINHDCHNIIVVGASDKDMVEAVNKLIDIDGGIVVTDGNGRSQELPLAIGGLMTSIDPSEVAASLSKLKAMAKDIGCKLQEPFLTLSFLALPVIPTLKITDKGLVDVTQFKLVPVVE